MNFTWSQGPNHSFLAEGSGGKLTPSREGEHRAAENAMVHTLNDQWNECELIVMGDAYAIIKVNGKILNYATQLSKAVGPIAMQAETAEIFYRNLKIKEFAEDRPASEFLQAASPNP